MCEGLGQFSNLKFSAPIKWTKLWILVVAQTILPYTDMKYKHTGGEMGNGVVEVLACAGVWHAALTQPQ